MITCDAFLQEARTWLGTPFHHQGRVKNIGKKKGGCDCIGLIFGVCKALDLEGKQGVIHSFDITGYSREPNGMDLKRNLEKHLIEIDKNDIKPADILLFRFEENPQHVGIVSNYSDSQYGIIHCYAQARKVVEHILDDYWKNKIVAAYRLNSLK